MSFTAQGLTAPSGLVTRPSTSSKAQSAPTGGLRVRFNSQRGLVEIVNEVVDANGVVASPSSFGGTRDFHYVVEYALFNPFRRSEISGWRTAAALDEGATSSIKNGVYQTIRINVVYRDGLGKTETVFGNPIQLDRLIPNTYSAKSTISFDVSRASDRSRESLAMVSEIRSFPPAQSLSSFSTVDSGISTFSVKKLGDALEGEAAVFLVERTGDLGQTSGLFFETQGYSTAKIGADFVGKYEYIHFGVGDSSKKVYVSTIADSQAERTEQFDVLLRSFNPASVRIKSGASMATASIYDRGRDPVTGGVLGSRLSQVVHATSGRDLLSGGSGRDNFFMAATPNFIANTFTPDRITNFSVTEGDAVSISASAYRLKSGQQSLASVSGQAEQSRAFASGAALVYDRLSGVLSINPASTIDGSGGGVIQFDNRPSIPDLAGVVNII